MRLLLFLVALGVTAAAQAQTNVFYVERGHWTVAITGNACRAFNRPTADFNASPYNALTIVARRAGEIGVEVFFWPGSLTQETDYQLTLTFGAGALTLAARATLGDFAPASAPERSCGGSSRTPGTFAPPSAASGTSTSPSAWTT
jgi:hypothetical protein